MVMEKLKEFTLGSHKEIEPMITGKTISGFETPEGMEDWLIFKFSDSTELRIRYSYIYEWELWKN